MIRLWQHTRAFLQNVTADRSWLVDLVEQLPQGRLSRAWGWLARRQKPRFAVGLLKRSFSAAVGIDLNEAALSMDDFSCLEDLFVRRLRPGMRTIDPDPTAVVSPVDGTLGQHGVVREGQLLQLKGRHYRLAELLESSQEAARFEGGEYITVYLAPHDYHRIHAPVAGEVRQAVAIPGGLRPVFAEALAKVDGLFVQNERLITYLDTPHGGRLALVKVGATLVGRITLSYDEKLWTNHPDHSAVRRIEYEPPKRLAKGDDLAAFELGSTVVLIFEPGQVTPVAAAPGNRVMVGEALAHMHPKPRKRSHAAKKRATP